MSEQARVLARSVAMIGIVVLVAVVVQNTSSSSAHSARNARIQELRAEITRVEPVSYTHLPLPPIYSV